MSDSSVFHHGRALRSCAVSYGSARVSPGAVSGAFSTRFAVSPARRAGLAHLAHRLDDGGASCTSRAQTPRRTAAAAKIPIPS